MSKNPCAKTVTPEKAYEVWANSDESWVWFVLKKYQTPEKEQGNQYARWYCAVRSPFTYGRLEYGDCYVREVTFCNHLIANPLVLTTGGQDENHQA